MCTLLYGTIPYKHFKIGGGWKQMVDARGITAGCHVMIGAPADGINQTLYFRVIHHWVTCFDNCLGDHEHLCLVFSGFVLMCLECLMSEFWEFCFLF